MAKVDVLNPKELKPAVEKYLGALAGKLICPLQLWYEGLGGQGVPNPQEMRAIEEAIGKTPGWTDCGIMRYEKFGMQQSFKRV